eukprot:jgi/Ulvmu1/12661/UM094_0017.1
MAWHPALWVGAPVATAPPVRNPAPARTSVTWGTEVHTGSGLQDCEQPTRGVYFCIRLSEAVVKTSAVLDGLCSAPGVATLPAMVSEEEFLLWSKSDPSSPPADTKDLAKVLRDADALSDKRMPV